MATYVASGLLARMQQICSTGFPGKVDFSSEGALLVRLTNKTGGNSVKGTLVESRADTDNAFDICDADGNHPIGVVYEDGIADAQECWICIAGRCQVLLQDSTASTRGYWARVSTTAAGRVDITNAGPPGGAVASLDAHMTEVGHCIETKGAGTNVLAYIILHFN